jgi:hypothetical protein
MKIVATLLVRNEADVLPAHLSHHAAHGIDAYCAADNGSTDGTLYLLAYCPLVLSLRHIVSVEDGADEYRQAEWVTQLTETAHSLEPDWLVHLDADEFWSGLETLTSVPAGVPCVRVASYDHLPEAGRVADASFRREDLPRRRPHPTHYKVAHRRIWGARVSFGNHSLDGHEQAPIWPGVVIDHYPVRSYEQFVRKVARGAFVMGNSGQPFAICSHWRQWGRALEQRRLYEVYYRLCAGVGVHESAAGF